MNQKKKKDILYRCEISRIYVHRSSVTVIAKSVTEASKKAKNMIDNTPMYIDNAVEGSDEVCSTIPIK